MATRRFITKDLLLMDSYCKLSAPAKNLLTYLIVYADDDGFVDNLTTIRRLSKVRPMAIRELSENGFVQIFSKELLAITHWRAMNNVPPSKYTETRYKAEKAELTVDENGIYHRKDERA